MRLPGLVLLCMLAGCGTPTSVRLQIDLAPDASAVTSGGLVLNLYGSSGRLFENHRVDGALPGDIVVLVDDDVGEARAWVRVVKDGAVTAAGTGRSMVPGGRETRLVVTLSTSPLVDGDGDGIPDGADDCPGMADPSQQSPCAGSDLATPTDFAVPDDGPPPDLVVVPCGNGMLDTGEQCDDGANNSDDPTASASCTTLCIKRSPCGALAGSTSSTIDPATGHCYVAWPTAVPWVLGERDCLTRGGHLASITSASENARVKNLVGAATSWIGIVNAGAQIVWSSGESNGYSGFKMGEPSMGATSCVVTLGGGGGWEDRPCGFPAVGLLPPSTVSTASYVCEHACGNGVIEAGEECDPPGLTCTAACRNKRACTEAGGMNSPATGICYFATATAVDYPTALTGSCPMGTHLATPAAPIETETAIAAITTDSWIALSAPTTAGVFQYDVAGPVYDSTRYHGFLDPDPDTATAPVSAAISKNGAQANGWRDRVQSSLYPAICERD